MRVSGHRSIANTFAFELWYNIKKIENQSPDVFWVFQIVIKSSHPSNHPVKTAYA